MRSKLYMYVVHKVLSNLQIEIHERKQIPIPNSWGVDAHGKVEFS